MRKNGFAVNNTATLQLFNVCVSFIELTLYIERRRVSM